LIDIKALLSLGCRSSLRIALGLPEDQLVKTRRLLSQNGCKVEVLGFADAHELVSSLERGRIDAGVRGTLSSSTVLRELRTTLSVKETMRTAVMEDAKGKPFLLTPVGIDEGVDAGSRLALAQATASYFSSAGWVLRVGVLSKGRPEDVSRGEGIRASLEEGEEIVEALRKMGHEAKHYGILIEDAVRECDLVVAPDGVSGNLIFRSAHFVGGGKAYGAPFVNLSQVFVDTSRAKADFSEAVLLAAGLAEVRRTPSERA
jgi:putative methanogen marker protein 4